MGIRAISVKIVFSIPLSSRNPSCSPWKTSEASGDAMSVLPSLMSCYLRISWSCLQKPFLTLFWHCWDITKNVDSGKSCEIQHCSAFGKTGLHVRARFGCLQGVVVPWGIRAGSLVPWDGVGCCPIPRGASTAERQSLGFWDASSKDSQPESCTWEQQECSFQETGGLLGMEPTTLALLLQV